MNTLGTRTQAEESRAVTAAVTGEGKGMQTCSLPSTPWVRARLGVPSCPGHPVMETAIQGGHGSGVALWGEGAEGTPETR